MTAEQVAKHLRLSTGPRRSKFVEQKEGHRRDFTVASQVFHP